MNIITKTKKTIYLSLGMGILVLLGIFSAVISTKNTYFNQRLLVSYFPKNSTLLLSNSKTYAIYPNTNNTYKDKKAGVRIIKNKNILSYTALQYKKNAAEKTIYHTLKSIAAGIYKIKLSDGTVVWLNAQSSIRFPARFLESENTRTVYLEGEAYFDVAKNPKKPFIVKTKPLAVKVLGTRFVVNTLKDTKEIKTTLIEGSVEVKLHNNTHVTLRPNQQLTLNLETQKTKVSAVKAINYRKWKDKTIFFEKEPFHAIAKKIERTYNITIHNAYTALENTTFSGEFAKTEISDILNTLSKSMPFTYSIKGSNVYIKE